MDIKYLPQMPDETSPRYLFFAIDRATRRVFMHIYGDMTDASSADFLARVDSNKWMIRLNDFPDEPLYTLIAGGPEIIHFNEWPASWNK